VDNWANNIASDLLDVPHVHITLTTDDLLRPFFHADRSLLKVLLTTAAQAVRDRLSARWGGWLLSTPACVWGSFTRLTPQGVIWALSLTCIW